MSVTIISITGTTILDSRKTPTLSVTVKGSDGSTGTFDVPSGASTGVHEAHELRDNGTAQGGVSQALSLLEAHIAPTLIGKDLYGQKEIDELLIKLDGTPNKSKLGGNTLIGISIALAKASAMSQKKQVWQHLHDTYFPGNKVGFPRLYANLVNGGKHAQTSLAFQEYHVVPKTTNMKEASSLIARIQETLGEEIIKQFGPVKIGDEGGFALPVADVEKPLLLLRKVVDELGVKDQVDFALDVAAASFFDGRHQYVVGGTAHTVPAMISLYEQFCAQYNLLSLEDPFQEEDFASFTALQGRTDGALRVGDDLTTTNRERLSRAVTEKSVDAIIIKPNQVGTLTETIDTMIYAQENGIKCIVSHRSGETMDDFIVDLAYASGVFGLKLGAHGPAEREVKYARLLAIENAQ